MDNNYSCESCLYANGKGDLTICDRRLLLDGREIIVEASKVGLSCVCHSDRFVEETRYMVNPPNGDARKSFDSCQVCGRRYDEMNEDNYDIVVEKVKKKEKNDEGKEIEIIEEHIVRKCRICIEKERKLFE